MHDDVCAGASSGLRMPEDSGLKTVGLGLLQARENRDLVEEATTSGTGLMPDSLREGVEYEVSHAYGLRTFDYVNNK
eukprot:1411537-Pyramimonas_sp.AAC.1